MELKVGMYVRIKNKVGYCVIGKIENINDYRDPMTKYCIDIQANDLIFVPEEMITKASNNIIDLIEVGDYVNDIEVTSVNKTVEGNVLIGLGKVFGFSKLDNDYTIKSIVTKEQFESISYKVNNE